MGHGSWDVDDQAAYFKLALDRRSNINAISAYEYEYFKFALQWPPTLCMAQPSDHRMTPIPNTFIVHGLWPTNRTIQKEKGARCEDNEFSYSQIKSLEHRLQLFWPIFIGKHKKFWEYEWDTYEAWDVDDQAAYFMLALDRRRSINVISVLQSKNIQPSRTKKYHQ
ncbi:ribonuclease S-4-like [Lotus japonicus]|uniref:ribonuclease S-4-like n=1 Tax=Lotus japonicus TaxID=34305 RepID=UPI002583BD16|nr:ribonuclease S-4-like [Lotus japonicus]